MNSLTPLGPDAVLRGMPEGSDPDDRERVASALAVASLGLR